MSSTKLKNIFVLVTVLCVTSLVAGNPVELTASRQQGGAVIFYAAFQGQLRDILFNPIVFNEVLVNQGSAYNNDTGVFTAPVAGVYQFVFTAQLCRGDHNNKWYFMVNGNGKMLCHSQVSGPDTTLNTCYYMEELKRGDQVWVMQKVGSCAWASTISKTITFSGVLLSREGASMLEGKSGPGSSCPLPNMFRHRDPPGSSSAGRRASLSCGATALLLCSLFLDSSY